jgi:hypothetical protein
VELDGTLDKIQLPLFESEEGRRVVDYFRTAVQEIQSKTEQHGTTIEVLLDGDSRKRCCGFDSDQPHARPGPTRRSRPNNRL